MIIKDGTQQNVESVSVGVTTSHWLTARKYLVYRYIGSSWQLRHEAVKVARLLAVDSLAKESGDELVKYASMAKMSASVFRRKSHGRFASKRIERLVQLCDDLESGKKSSADLRQEGLGMICSELIVTCYEVAAHRLTGKGVMNVDPRAMTSKALEARLSRSGEFALQGVFVGQVPQTLDVRGHHPAIAEVITREVAAGNAIIENNLDQDNEERTLVSVCEMRDAFKLKHTLNELNSHNWKYDATVNYFPVGTASQLWAAYKTVYVQQGYEITSTVRAPKSNMAMLMNNSPG